MPLDPKYIDISVAGGIDAKSDRKIVRPPATLRADNVQYSTAGSVRKRYGLTFLPQPKDSNTNVQSFGSTLDELLATDKSFMYAYSPESNAWAQRGVAPQCAVGTSSLGTFKMPSTFTPSNGVRSLTYEVINGIGLAALDYGDNLHSTNISTLSTITLILFDTTTNKILWRTTITGGFRTNSMAYDVLTANVQTPTVFYQDFGVAYPIIRAYKGNFYLGFVSCFSANVTFNGANSTPGFVYPINLYRMGTPASLAAQMPVISPAAYSGCTRILFGSTAGGITPASFRGTAQYPGAQPAPIYYDLSTNGDSLALILNTQLYGKSGTTTPVNSPGLQFFSLANASQPYLDLFQAAVLPAGFSAGVIALSGSPLNSDGTLPANAIYAASTPDGLLVYRAPYYNSGPAVFQQSKIFDGVKPTYSQPIACKVIDNGTFYEAYVTEGLNYQRVQISSVNGAMTTLENGKIVVDYATDFGPFINTSAHTTGSFLQSRLFFAPDGQLVCWVMPQLYQNDTFNTLVLVPVGSQVTPKNSIYASCFYLRVGAALYARNPCNVVDSAILNYQLTDIPNKVAALKRIRIDAQPYPSICKLQQGALITGGNTKYYDGNECRALGWMKFPELPYYGAASTVPYPGFTNPNFAYVYKFVWVDFDAYGNQILSSTSPAVYLQGSNSSAPGAIAQGNYPGIRPDMWATLTNTTRGELQIYRNNSKDPLTFRRVPMFKYSSGNVDFPNDPWYYDASPDDNSAAPQIYAQTDGELDNDPPPASTFAITTMKRPFVASAENRSWLYFGKPYLPGRAPEFNATSFLDIDPPSGDITGLAVLDQNVIIFKRERIFVLAGDGPDAVGKGNFNNTLAVATDTGCLDSNSIVSTETGVYFRSIRGIQMIDRSLQVSYPGAQVERIVNSSTITSAVLVPSQNQIRFALRSNDPLIAGTGADNVVLVLDYLQTKWSTYSFNPGYDPRYSLRVAGQAFWKNNYFALAGNSIFQDGSPQNTQGILTYVDAPTKVPPNAVPMTIETGWVPLAGPQGWGRLRRVNVLGDFRTAHSLTLYFGWDYNEEYTYSVPYIPGALTPGNAENWRVRAPRQVGQAVRFKLVDDGTGEAIVITGLELETSQKSGATRVPDMQSV